MCRHAQIYASWHICVFNMKQQSNLRMLILWKMKPLKTSFGCQVRDAGFLPMRQSCFKSMQRLLQFPRSLASSPPSVFHFIKCSWAHASWALSGESDSWLRENAFHCPFQKKRISSLFPDLVSIIPQSIHQMHRSQYWVMEVQNRE